MKITEEQLSEIKRRQAIKPGNYGVVHIFDNPITRKYRNVKTVADGIRFDSKLEAKYYEHLKSLGFFQGRGTHIALRQVPFDLEGGVRYRCDFFLIYPRTFSVIDCTGVMTQTKRNKLKQVKARYGIEVQIIKHGDF